MNSATALREIRRCLKNGETTENAYNKFADYLNFPELNAILNKELKYSIIIHYATNNEKSLLRFANGLTDDQFDFARYEEYKNFRMTNKTDSWSEQFFKLKFGKDWQHYYSSARSKRLNPYDASSVAKKYNYSLQVAENMVSILKEKTKPSLKKYIEKYGKDIGTEKFFKTSRYHKNYIDYWNKLYPNNSQLAHQKFKEYTSSINLKHVNFYLKRGYTKDEAEKLISDHQMATAGVHRKYYENLGIVQDEIDKIMLGINKRKDSCSIKYIKSMYPTESSKEIIDRYRLHNFTKSSTYRSNGFLRKDDPELEKRTAYYATVDYYTKQSIRLMEPCPGKRGKNRGEYHIDHKFSKHEGFKNNVPPYIVGHVVNLQWLLTEENCSKRANCHLTKEELLLEYQNYENQIN